MMDQRLPEPLLWPKGTVPDVTQLAMSTRVQRELRLATEFAMYAAASDDLQALLQEVCRVAAEGLGTVFAKLLVYLPGERAFVLQAGVGWRDGVVGHARLDADVGTAAGFAWRSGRPIVSNNLLTGGRFRVPELLIAHGIVRCVNVAVPGGGELAFGVLEVESPEPGRFAAHDAHFLQLLALSLAAAIGQTDRQGLHDEETTRQADDDDLSRREMQHRVRNDLLALCDSLDGEARGLADTAQRDSLERISRRLLALATLYDHLLPAQSDASVDIGAYLGALCATIADAADLPARRIALTADTPALPMPADQAVRLAIAVNELIASAAAHAFPDARAGTITVQLRAGGEGTGGTVVTVADDGVGFTGRPAERAGLALVERLARQAGAELVHHDGPGTRWTMTLL